MNTLLKRIISLVLCLVMVVGYVPVNAFADETGEAVSTEAPEVTPDAPAVVTDEESEPEIPEAPKPEAPKPEAPKPEAPKPEAPKPEAPKPEAPKPEAPKPEAPKTEPEEPEAPKTEQEEPPVTEEIVPSVIAVTGITLDQTALEVTVGELPMTLTATVQPEDATDKTVTWTSSEPGVASVDENGTLTFGYMGEATITVTAGEFSASCVVTVGEGEWDTYEGGKVVIAASDYQRSDSGTIMTNIMNHIKDDYGSAYGALLGGDYDAGSVSTKASHIQAVDETISGVFSEIDGNNRVYIQGNHENYAGLKPSSSNLLTMEHVRDTEYYGVYAINHDDFPWTTSYNPAPSESLVQGTADDLGNYLDAKIAAGYT